MCEYVPRAPLLHVLASVPVPHKQTLVLFERICVGEGQGKRASHCESGRMSVGVLPAATHLVQFVLLAGEGEGEAQREGSPLHAHVLQEVSDAMDNVVKQLTWHAQKKNTKKREKKGQREKEIQREKFINSGSGDSQAFV